MEQPILIIAGLILLALGGYIFIWWKSNKKQDLISETNHEEILASIENLKTGLETHAKSFDVISQKLTTNYEEQNKQVIEHLKNENSQFKTSLTDSHGEALKKITDELSKIVAEVKDEFSNLKNENKQFKSSLNDAHEEALKKLSEELSKLLNEIKSPLNID